MKPLFAACAMTLLLAACSVQPSLMPLAQGGQIDLSHWDFERQGSVRLDGEYQFFWQELFEPSELANREPVGGLADLPGYWSDRGLPAHGYASYRLLITLPPADPRGLAPAPVYGLKITEVLTAFQLWVDGRLVYRNGQVGRDAEHSRPEYRPGVIYFSPRSDRVELLIQVSNFHYRKGGIRNSFYLGEPQSVTMDWYLNSHLNLFLVGGLVIMGLYHLGLFFLRRSDRSALWFGLFCFLVLLRVITTGDQLLSQWLPGFDWELARKLEFLTLSLGVVCFMQFIATLFRGEAFPWVRKLLMGAGLAFSLALVVLPAAWGNLLVTPMQALVLLAFAWLFYTVLRASLRRREGALLVLGGTVLLMLTVLNDMLYSNQLIHTGYFMPIGFFGFIFIQAFILAIKFSRSFQKAEFLGTALADTNRALKRFVPYEFLEFLHKKSIVDVGLGDQVQEEMCILFSDIRSFTGLSERLSPRENFNFLNSYLKRIGPVIRDHGGFIDKYLGDGIMALFPSGIEAGLHAAVDMLVKVAEYNAEREHSGFDPIRIGVALNVGHLMLGTIGEADRMDTTVISDAVNLTSRMESLSKIYGPGIIVTESAVRGLPDASDWLWRPLGAIRVRGRREAIPIVQVLNGLEAGYAARLKAMAAAWQEALGAYIQGDLGRADKLFGDLVRQVPEDPAARVYLARTRSWLAQGLPPDWDGVEDAESLH